MVSIVVTRPYPRHPPCAVECRCDGNQVYALIGSDYMTGVVGFGDTLPDALRALADELEREVGQEPERKMLPTHSTMSEGVRYDPTLACGKYPRCS